ncbi:GlxA family transcriptional regulator [Catenulispora yoronensis]|uniref:GlxA family transcriptional regulator n=1 Tax=Catenulispora yoronensis TaxID=450799 RepID=A0ABP5GE39_9ACTN
MVFLVFPGFQMLDLTCPLEVFAQADSLFRLDRRRYETEVVAVTAEAVVATDGLAVVPHRTMAEAAELPVDTLVVVGGKGVREVMRDAVYVDWVRGMAAGARRVTSVCSGALLLAATGLLDGRRVATHWSACEELARGFPKVQVETDPIFIRSDPYWTSAGVTAGLDLAMALVEDDFGAEAARRIAKQLVVFVQRSGGQSQFSTQLAAQRPGRDSLREVQGWIADHLDDDLSLPALARRAALSERHFSRVFRAETGMTVAAYVEAVRVEAARRLLESTGEGLERIARSCGFGTVETMHRTFNRAVRVTPGEYRRHFRRGVVVGR